jgi:hypothetical protein
MKRKIILYGGLFFLISILAASAFVNSALAMGESCQYDKDCLVPAPTLVVPMEDFSIYADKLVITGLSWNETLVDVYIDGIYNGRAELNLDESGVGNFAYKTYLPVTPGSHTVYTVARNLNERERSIESVNTFFTIIARPIVVSEEEEVFIADENNVEDENISNDTEESEEIADSSHGVPGVIVGVDDSIDSSNIGVAPIEEGDVNVGSHGAIEGGVWEQKDDQVSDLQKTIDRDQIINEFFSEDSEIFAGQRDEREKQNRQIGFAMLGVIIVITIVWMIVGSQGLPVDRKNDMNDTKDMNVEEVSITNSTNKEDVSFNIENDIEKVEDVMDDELDKLI